MRLCARCVLPETFPGVQFDAEGVCRFCREFDCKRESDVQRERNRNKFEEISQKVRGKADYDCLLAYSGGKDSTYTLWLLRRHYRLSVLAVTLDNGFISPAALENVRRMVDVLDVDHILVRPRAALLESVFRKAATESPFPPKALERASSICNACISLVKNVTLRIAIEQGIPVVAYGFSPGQADARGAILKLNASMLKSMHASRAVPLLKLVGEELSPYLLREHHLAGDFDLPFNVNPLAFHECDEDRMTETIEELGWTRPMDTDGNSTNCLLNAYANRLHIRTHGFHPYAFEVAGLVRCGAITRGQGLTNLADLGSEAVCRSVADTLGLVDISQSSGATPIAQPHSDPAGQV